MNCGNVEINGNTNAPKVFTSEEWYLIFKYAYRTISITKKENELLDNGYKSKRAFSAYDKLNIQVCSEDKSLWAELHKI